MTSENCEVGMFVRRGRDWMSGSQDHFNGKKATGIITLCDKVRFKLVQVYWAGGTKQVYRIGALGAFDLSIKGI